MKIQLKTDRTHGDKQDAEKVGAGLSLANIALMLSVPLVGMGIYLSLQFLADPLNFAWLQAQSAKTASVAVPILNPPQSIEEIEAELAKSQQALGNRLILKTDRAYRIYPVLDAKSKEIEEIRIYEPALGDLPNKLRLTGKLNIAGLDEFFVKAPILKYTGDRSDIPPKSRKLPLTELQTIEGKDPSQGIWFVATGKADSVVYGQVISFASQPKPVLNVLLDWTSPEGKLPTWQSFTSARKQELPANSDRQPGIDLKVDEPQLVLDRTQDFEPDFQVFQVESTSNPLSPLQLRQINLNEGLGLPHTYNEALILASGNLWSPALVKLNALKSELQAKGQSLSPYVQEQYDLIAYHAKITAEQAEQTIADTGQEALMLLVDGRWQKALAVAKASEFTAKSAMEMLQQNQSHIWPRVLAAVSVQPPPEVKIWGALVVLQRQGLPAAQQWLQAQKGATKEAIALIEKLDLSPLKMQPQELVGTITPLGKSPGTEWVNPPPSLPSGQAWYAVDVGVIRDGNSWENAPFPELGQRAPHLVWQALGMENNSLLSVTVSDNSGQQQVETIAVKSFWVGSNGNLRLLAMGSADLANEVKGIPVPAMVKGVGDLPAGESSTISLTNLEKDTANRIIAAVYGQLLSLGQISLAPDAFKRELEQWSLLTTDLTGDGIPDFILEITRDRIDAGDRHYPVVLAFDSDGKLLFSDLAANANRRWIALLQSAIPGQVLTAIDGRYEVWSLKQ